MQLCPQKQQQNKRNLIGEADRTQVVTWFWMKRSTCYWIITNTFTCNFCTVGIWLDYVQVKSKVAKAKADLQNTTTWKSMIITYKMIYICWPKNSTTEQYWNGTLRLSLISWSTYAGQLRVPQNNIQMEL